MSFLFSNQLKKFVARSWANWWARDWNPTPRTFNHRNLTLHSSNNIWQKQLLFIVYIIAIIIVCSNTKWTKNIQCLFFFQYTYTKGVFHSPQQYEYCIYFAPFKNSLFKNPNLENLILWQKLFCCSAIFLKTYQTLLTTPKSIKLSFFSATVIYTFDTIAITFLVLVEASYMLDNQL